MNESAIRAAREAAAEIRRLRSANELLAAKVHVMEFFECLLHTRPAMPSSGYAEDAAWKLDQVADEMAAELAAEMTTDLDGEMKAEG